MGSPHWLARDNRIPGGRGSLLQWTAYDLAFRVALGVAAGWGFGTLLNRLGRGAGEVFGKKTSEGIFDAITVRGALIAVLLVLVWMACTARPAAAVTGTPGGWALCAPRHHRLTVHASTPTITAPTITTGQTDGVGPAPSLRPTSLLVSNGVVVDLYSLILFGDVLTTVQVVVARNWLGAFWVVDRILVDLNALSPTTLLLVG